MGRVIMPHPRGASSLIQNAPQAKRTLRLESIREGRCESDRGAPQVLGLPPAKFKSLAILLQLPHFQCSDKSAKASHLDSHLKRLDLDTFPFQTRFRGAYLVILQIARADLGSPAELIESGTGNNTDPSLLAPSPFSALIKTKSDISRVIFFIAYQFPRTMTATEHRMRVSASKESAVRGECEEILSDTSRTTRGDNPRSD